LRRNIRLFIGNTFNFIIELLQKLEIKTKDLYNQSIRTTSPDIILLFHKKSNSDINKDDNNKTIKELILFIFKKDMESEFLNKIKNRYK
jgi:hypothetical protein